MGSAVVDYAPRASGLTLPAEVHRASLGSRRDSPGAGLRSLQPPLTSTELGGLLALATLRIPDPQFPAKTPAGRRSNRPVPAPGGQPDPTLRVEAASVAAQLRWARGPDDERVPLLTDAAGSGFAVPAVSQGGTASPVEHASRPVRSPGAHLHPQLRRPPWASGCGARGRS